MPEGSGARVFAGSVTAGVSLVSAVSRRIGGGIAEVMGDPVEEAMPPEMAALVAALEAAERKAVDARGPAPA